MDTKENIIFNKFVIKPDKRTKHSYIKTHCISCCKNVSVMLLYGEILNHIEATINPECAEHIFISPIRQGDVNPGANGPKSTVFNYYPVPKQQLLLEVIHKTNRVNEYSPAKFVATTNHCTIMGY